MAAVPGRGAFWRSTACESGVLPGALLLLAAGSAAAGAAEPFFDISISLPHGDAYLEGEGVTVELAISNNTGKALRYLRAGEYVSALHFIVSNDEGPVLPTESHGGVIDSPDLARAGVSEFPSGGTVTRRLPCISGYRKIKPGDYTLRVRLVQRLTDWGIAKGEADSNSVRFTIVPWVAVRTRTLAVGASGAEQAGLLDTNTRHLLVGWRYPGRSPWAALAKIADGREHRAAAWAADEKDCYVQMVSPSGHDSLVLVDKAKGIVARLPWVRLDSEKTAAAPPRAPKASGPEVAEKVPGAEAESEARARFGVAALLLGLGVGVVLGASGACIVLRKGRVADARKQTPTAPGA